MLLNFVQRLSAHPIRLAAAASLALAVTACGGGGGSPGVTTGTPIPPEVKSVILMNNTSTIDVGGAGATEVVIDALVRDSNNNVIPNIAVNFAASSGTVTYVNKVTDAFGMSRARLTTPGELTPREITVTATAQSITSLPLKIQVVNSTATP